MDQNRPQHDETKDMPPSGNVIPISSERATIDRPMDSDMPPNSPPPHAEDKQSDLNVPGGKGNTDVADHDDTASGSNPSR